MNTALDREPLINLLIEEYDYWNKEQGLKLGSADEHHDDPHLTEEQRSWLRNFSHRWEQALRPSGI